MAGFDLKEMFSQACRQIKGEFGRPSTPSQLERYEYDDATEQRHRRKLRILGYGVLLGVAAIIVGFLSTAFDPSRIGLVCGAVTFFVLVFVWGKAKTMRHKMICGSCGHEMEPLDVNWTLDEWKKTGRGFEQQFTQGADGYLYVMLDAGHGDGRHAFDIWQNIQRWYVCHTCRKHFLGEVQILANDSLFRTYDKQEAAQALDLIRTDPNAVTNGKLSLP